VAALDSMEGNEPPLEATATVAFLRNVTIEGIEPYLKYYLYLNRIRPTVLFGGYDSLRQDLVSSESPLRDHAPTVVALTLYLDQFDEAYGRPGWSAAWARDELEALFEFAREHTQATIAVNTFLLPFYAETGSVLPGDGSDLASQVRGLNDFVRSYVSGHAAQFCLLDWERYVRLLGEQHSMDYRYWYMARAPFKKAFLSLYAKEIARIVRNLKGRTKKWLLLDCDNTLWGGIIGEDGVEGIKLDGHDYPGKAYYDFQKTLLHLVDRGVLITICSKNNEADVLAVLENHPWCLLKPTHLSAWRINWEDKASNIAALAEELNLGMDASVFVDDNPRECELVKQLLPEVTVLQVPERLYLYPQLLLKDGLFDTLTISAEDKQRAAMYQSESQRKRVRASYHDLDDYLSSLQIVATIHLATPGELPRVAQLTQKTNQFNLTTRRYSESEIAQMTASNAIFTLTASDRFGTLGLVGVFIAGRDGDVGTIDSYLMSCRALGRELETAFAAHCLKALETNWRIRGWKAEFVPTRKNQQTAEFWDKLGFANVESSQAGKQYFMEAGKVASAPAFIAIVSD